MKASPFVHPERPQIFPSTSNITAAQSCSDESVGGVPQRVKSVADAVSSFFLFPFDEGPERSSLVSGVKKTEQDRDLAQ